MRAVRLPGVNVVAVPAPAVEALPRMDVALFVGFASRGPVHCPVVVDSVAAFGQTFGPDPLLAFDPALGGAATGLLGPSVRAFFENGGRRAMIIRTCRT